MNKYKPSNGTSGEYFMQDFCYQCVHDHSPTEKHCEIITLTMCFGVDDPEYPSEWIYDSNDKPTCTKFKKWDWGNGDDGWNFPPEPPKPPSDDPNQLMIPYSVWELLGIQGDILVTKGCILEKSLFDKP